MPSRLPVAPAASVALAVASILIAKLTSAGVVVWAAVRALAGLPVVAWLAALLRPAAAVRAPSVPADVQQQLDMAAALRDIGQDILTRTDLEDILQRVVGHARRLLDADLVAVAAPSPAGMVRWAAVAGNRTDAWERLGFAPAAGILTEVLADGCSLVVSDADGSLPGQPPSAEDGESEGLQTLVAVPLTRGDGEVIGALLAGYRMQREVRPPELLAAEALANQAAIALQNAQLIEQLRQAERLKDEFLSRAAHELKTPITSLRGFAQLTLRQLEPNGPEPPNGALVRHSLHVIDEQTERLARLVAQLLDVSQLAGGLPSIAPRPTDLVAVLHRAVNAVQATTSRHTLRLRGPGAALLDGDPARIEQVAVSLLDNAIKFSPEGGDILVEVGRPDAATVSFSVTDWGIGVPPEHRPRIFDLAYQAHSGQHFAGMGLGLSLSRAIVQAHGGQIVAEFPDEGGARFVVTLPVHVAGNGATPGPASAGAASAMPVTPA